MNSIKSFFSISPPLILENLRRFWTIPAFGFAGYFLTGLFPIILDVENRDYMFRSILEFRHPGFIIFFCLFPLITAAVLQRYMFAPGSVAVMHSLPFTRSGLFNSQFVSGLLLVWLPLVAICLISLAMSLVSPWEFVEYGQTGIITAPFIIGRFALMLLLTFFVFAVCILAGVVCGNTPMHLVVCGLLNSILPMIVTICYFYCAYFLFGFDDGSESLDFVGALSPMSHLPLTAGAPGALTISAYIVASILICVFASILYARRPLEKAGDSITFRFMEWVICFATTLAGMTLMAAYFRSLPGPYSDRGDMYFYLGMAVGAVITMLITRIILKKSPRIWNRETAVQFGAFAVAALVLVTSLSLDLFGYERKIPADAKIESATLNIPTQSYPLRIIQPYTYSGAGFYTFSEPESIAAITALHRDIIARRNTPIKMLPYYEAHSEMRLQYGQPGLWGGLSRRWSLPVEFFAQNENLRRLVELDEFRAQNSLDNPKLGTLRQMSIRDYADSEQISLSSYEFDGFKAAVNADLRSLPAEQIFGAKIPLCQLYADFQMQAGGEPNIATQQLNLIITSDFKNTLGWLADNGYYDRLAGWADTIDSIQLTHVVEGEREGTISFSDPALIRMALDYGESSLFNESEYYEILPITSPSLADGRQATQDDWQDLQDDWQDMQDDWQEAQYYWPELLDIKLPPAIPHWYLSPGNPALEVLLSATGE
jgi:ABC-2 type transport system permease protein